ncbi:MAG: response regulator transcription factor [Actinomycetota bacterium]|nr:response regulator transcription factor [Actinomycetota bacterium]MDQ3577543.1 response regulator transcription factor [Actinomycetota bacterium]
MSGAEDKLVKPTQLATRVVVAIRDDLLRYGIERMLQTPSIGSAVSSPSLPRVLDGLGPETQFLVTLLSEVDIQTEPGLRCAGEHGVKVLLLLKPDEFDDVAKAAGIRGAGFLLMDALSEAVLLETLSRMRNGEVLIPAELAHTLLALAGKRDERIRPRPRITPREQQALLLMVDGLSNKQIAVELRISENGAKRLVASILAKLDCPNRTLAVSKALREGLYEQYSQVR